MGSDRALCPPHTDFPLGLHIQRAGPSPGPGSGAAKTAVVLNINFPPSHAEGRDFEMVPVPWFFIAFLLFRFRRSPYTRNRSYVSSEAAAGRRRWPIPNAIPIRCDLAAAALMGVERRWVWRECHVGRALR